MVERRKGIAPDAKAIEEAALYNAIEDWSVMINAVAMRLDRAVEGLSRGPEGGANLQRIAESLRECSEALQHVRDAQVHEIVRRQQRPLNP